MAEKKTVEKEDYVKSMFITMPSGERYELDFNREAVVFAERRGFVIDDVTKFPASLLPDFFYYAFRMHHKRLTRTQTDDILDTLGGLSSAMVERLIQLYYQAGYNGLVVKDDELKNSGVTVEL